MPTSLPKFGNRSLDKFNDGRVPLKLGGKSEGLFEIEDLTETLDASLDSDDADDKLSDTLEPVNDLSEPISGLKACLLTNAETLDPTLEATKSPGMTSGAVEPGTTLIVEATSEPPSTTASVDFASSSAGPNLKFGGIYGILGISRPAFLIGIDTGSPARVIAPGRFAPAPPPPDCANRLAT